MRRESRERFPPLSRLSETDMHHGTCVTHVPWCMSGSLTSGFLRSRWRGKRSRHFRRMRNPRFYVSRRRPMIWYRNEFSKTSLTFPLQNIRHIVEQIVAREKSDIHLALIEYRDHPPQDYSFVTRVHNFTALVKEMKSWLESASAHGGGDGPEAVADAWHALLKLNWRENATKICVHIADAPPHGLMGGKRDSTDPRFNFTGVTDGFPKGEYNRRTQNYSQTLFNLCSYEGSSWSSVRDPQHANFGGSLASAIADPALTDDGLAKRPHRHRLVVYSVWTDHIVPVVPKQTNNFG